MSDMIHVKFRLGERQIDTNVSIRDIGRMLEESFHENPDDYLNGWEGAFEVILGRSLDFNASDDEWQRVHWSSPTIAIDTSAPHWRAVSVTDDVCHWLFFHNDKNPKGPYRHIEIGQEFRVDATGTIWYEDDITISVSPNWEDQHPTAWPWILLNPNAWVALKFLDDLLSIHDENPLTILLRCGFPYKGNAKQVRTRLREIKKLLKRSLIVESEQ